MKDTVANSVKMMAFYANQNVQILRYNYVTNTWTQVSTGDNFNTSSYGSAMSASPSHGGYTYVGTDRGQGAYLLKVNQSGQFVQQFVNMASYTGKYMMTVMALDDGTTTGTTKGHVYWGTYYGGNVERSIYRIDDNTASSMGNLDQSYYPTFNSGAYSVGGNIIGERPRYAEFDAHLASPYW